jgi:hypothetical protein
VQAAAIGKLVRLILRLGIPAFHIRQWHVGISFSCIDNIPTNMPTKRQDISKQHANVGERSNPRIS